MSKPNNLNWDLLKAHADTLTNEQRRKVTDRWTRAAQAEHASIAAFDRFALQLLSIGAPPLLLEQAHLAAIDEVHHAQLTFAVASIYAGQSLGPGPLSIPPSVFADFSVREVLRSAVDEGCVNETIAAAEADTASQRVTCVPLQQVLKTIADDEAEHAALAYRFAAWALGAFGNDGRTWIEEGFQSGFGRFGTSQPSSDNGDAANSDDAWLEAHGLLSDRARAECCATALSEVVTPARRTLLGQ